MTEPQRETQDVVEKRDWRDTMRDASDLALLGIVVFVAALPLVTAGAAVGAGSAAVHEFCANDRYPPVGDSLRRFGRGILPGLGAVLVAAAVWALLMVDVAALRAGAVPGGRGLIAATLAIAVVLAGLAAVIVVEVGRTEGRGWLAAGRRALRTSISRPVVPLAAGAVTAFAVLLGFMLPVCVPILAGYLLFAVHVTVRRLAPERAAEPFA